MTFKYNWDNYPQVKELLLQLYNNTKKYFNINTYHKEYIKEFIEDTEEYIYCIKKFEYDLDRVIYYLNNVEYISFQEPILYTNNGIIQPNFNKSLPVINLNGIILLNPSIKDNKKLTSRERRKLYLFKGLSQNILNFKNETTLKFSKIYNDYLGTYAYQTQLLINNGWLLLEDVLAQEIAEKFTYYILNKPRPNKNFGKDNTDKDIFPNEVALSNLELSKMFQPILLSLGLALRNIGNITNYSEEIITYELLKKAINQDFSKEIIAEFIDRNQELTLYQILYAMGIIINEKYTKYGMRLVSIPKIDSNDIEKIYNELIKLLQNLITFNNTKKETNNVKIKKRKLNIYELKKLKRLIHEVEIEP